MQKDLARATLEKENMQQELLSRKKSPMGFITNELTDDVDQIKNEQVQRVIENKNNMEKQMRAEEQIMDLKNEIKAKTDDNSKVSAQVTQLEDKMSSNIRSIEEQRDTIKDLKNKLDSKLRDDSKNQWV